MSAKTPFHDESHPSVKVVVTGGNGNGKTTLLKKLILSETAKFNFGFDHKENNFAPAFGVKPCYTFDEILERVAQIDESDSDGIILFNPSRMIAAGNFEDNSEAFNWFCKIVFDICQKLPGLKIFFADELHVLIKTSKLPVEFIELESVGRTSRINNYFATSSINRLHVDFRGLITEAFAFRHGDKGSCEWLEEQAVKWDEIKELKNGEWIYTFVGSGITVRGGEAFKPKGTRRDLSAL